jgi:predicted NUDIX family phosphoesterase
MTSENTKYTEVISICNTIELMVNAQQELREKCMLSESDMNMLDDLLDMINHLECEIDNIEMGRSVNINLLREMVSIKINELEKYQGLKMFWVMVLPCMKGIHSKIIMIIENKSNGQ